MTKQKNVWKIAFWVLLVVSIIISGVLINSGFNAGFEEGYNFGLSESESFYGGIYEDVTTQSAEILFDNCVDFFCYNEELNTYCGDNIGADEIKRWCGEILNLEELGNE